MADQIYFLIFFPGNNDKKITTKNVQLLSPGNQNSKKSRTSPRVSVPSHKFARQTSTVIKSSLRSSLKPGYGSNTSVKVDTKKTKEGSKLGSKNGHQKTQSGKALSLGSSKSGLCETGHKKIDVCSLCMKRQVVINIIDFGKLRRSCLMPILESDCTTASGCLNIKKRDLCNIIFDFYL